MPVCVQNISQIEDEKVKTWILNQIHHSKLTYVSKDNRQVLLETDLIDQLTSKSIGKIVYTTKNEEKVELLDIDIILNNENTVNLTFLERLPQSSECNEYYLVEIDNGCRFLIETVNRYMIEEKILNTSRDVSLSLFPFEISFYHNMEDANIGLGVTKNDLFRFDEHFISPISLFNQSDDVYSFLIGKVLDYKEVILDIDGYENNFMIVYVDTVLGIVPATFNRFTFDSEMIKIGKYITMYTYIKANFKVD